MDINTCFATTAEVRDLALYSHLIPAAAVLILAVFSAWRAKNKRKMLAFLGFCTVFAYWLLADLLLWTINDYTVIAAFWASLDYANIIFFALLFYFVCTDFLSDKVPAWLSVGILAAVVIPFTMTVQGIAVLEFDQPNCEMYSNEFLTQYKLGFEFAILLATLLLGSWKIIQSHDWHSRIRVALVTLSIVLFMGVFAGTEFVATTTGFFEINLYALLALPLFIMMLTIAITSYDTFRLGDAAIKLLFYIFLVLSSTQFFFVQDIIGFSLAAMSVTVIITMGVLLFISNEREKKLTVELEKINKQQEGLIHFVSHEVKGYLTKSAGVFSGIIEGDYGKSNITMETVAKNALLETRKGIDEVINILKASNLKKGTVIYKMEPFDFAALLKTKCIDLETFAETKGLTFSLSITEGVDFTIKGDAEHLGGHVIRNIIENAINYTPTGNVSVELKKVGNKAVLTVQDTGVGITEEDKQKLFTEGGHGKDSIKVNVHSTGYGLYIAKNIVEAHGGTISAHSEGSGKGSTFVIELPM